MNMQDITSHFKQFFEKQADSTAVIDHMARQTYSYRQLEDLSSRLAWHLRDYANRNAKISLLFSNQMEMVLGYLMCLQLGATAVPINPEFHPDEIAGFIKHAKPDAILTSHAFIAKLEAAPKPEVVCFGPHASDPLSLEMLASGARLSDAAFPYLGGDMLACIMFTSGSTGVPKAIPLRFYQVAGQAQLIAQTHARDAGSRFYMVLPLAYIGGLHQTLVYFFAGGSVVIDQVFSASSIYRFWDTVLLHKANCLWLTPSMIAALMAIGPEDDDQARRIGRQVKWAIAAMGPVSAETKQQFEAMFGITLQKAYGITETLLCCSWKDKRDLPVDSIGSPMPGLDVIIASDEGEALPVGMEGEIRVKGPWVLEEYYHQPDQTAAAFDTQGYFRTGDLGRMDSDGNVFITGRIKDIIKRGGLNISPVEIETVLVRMDAIREAAVIGIPDEMYGEKVAAVITLSDNASLRMEDVTRYCLQYLSEIKVPAIVHTVERLPLNPSGKPDKRALKAMLVKELKLAS